MKLFSKKLITLVLVFVLIFSITSISAATATGGVCKFVDKGVNWSQMTWALDVYLSDSAVKTILGIQSFYNDSTSVISTAEKFFGFIEFLMEPNILYIAARIPEILGIPNPITGPIYDYVKANITDIERASTGSGIIIS